MTTFLSRDTNRVNEVLHKVRYKSTTYLEQYDKKDMDDIYCLNCRHYKEVT